MQRPELTLVDHFCAIHDYRENHNKRHILVEIIVVAVCCVICGADNFTEIEIVGNEKIDWFRTFLSLPKGIPSHDTFNRVFARINPAEVQNCFVSWVKATFPCDGPQQIAVDGKELHHSINPDDDFANLRMLSAWSVEQGLVLGQVAVNDDSNEITALPALLKVVDIAGCDLTADALHCQTDFADAIVRAQADYTVAVKANQKTLYNDIIATFTALRTQPDTKLATYETIEKDHGRIETRRYTTTADISRLTTRDAWNGLQSIGMVETERQIGTTSEQDTRYYISSREANVQAFATRVRGHWQIENCLHWRLDVIMNEDHAHIRVNHGPENMAVLRHIALNLLTHERSLKVGTQAKRLRAACSNTYLEKVIKMAVPS
jgi:predicted transposase YbfD/YdcC